VSRARFFELEHEGRRLRGFPLDQDRILEILELERACFSDPWTEAVFRQEARPEEHRWNLVLVDGGELAAYAINWVVSGEIHLLNFAVRPDLQGRGLGRKFLRWIMEEGRRAGDETFLLEVRAGNEAAKHLYESEGLRVLARREHYYPDSGEDALVMMRFLQDSDREGA